MVKKLKIFIFSQIFRKKMPRKELTSALKNSLLFNLTTKQFMNALAIY